MIKKGKHLIKSYMTLEYDFTGIRIQESSLTPVDWKLSVDLVVVDRKDKSKDILEIKAGEAYQKIYYWLDTNLPCIVAVDVGNEDDLYIANLSSNIMMYCPGNPSDDLLIQLLHSKISALAAPYLAVGEIRVKGSDTSLQYTYDCPVDGYDLPVLVEDYYPEPGAKDKMPWWTRDDGFCSEFIKPPDEAAQDDEYFSSIVDPLDEFRRVMAEMADAHIGLIREPAKIVQVEKWKPRTIE